MIKIRKLFSEKMNNKGFSLVELICTVAIMSIVTISAASICIICSKTYTRGANEIDVQQEAQFAANIIGNLVMDSTKTPTFNSTTSKWEFTEGTDNFNLYIEDNKLKISGASMTEPEVLVENIDSFDLDVSRFSSNKSVKVKMKVLKAGREFDADYEVTSRNGKPEVVAVTTQATINISDKIVVEPNMDIEYAIDVSGTGLSTKAVDVEVVNKTDPNTIVYYDSTSGKHRLKIGTNETTADLLIEIKTQEKKPGTTIPVGIKTGHAYVRRVTGITIDGRLLTPEDTNLKNGAEYELTAIVTGTNLDEIPDAHDLSYGDPCNPRTVNWKIVYSEGGVEKEVESIKYSYIPYPDTQKIKITLKADITETTVLAVIAEASHSRGMVASERKNRTGLPYVGTTNPPYMYTPITASYYIMKSPFTPMSDLERGTNESNGAFNLVSTLNSELNTKYPADNEHGFAGYTPVLRYYHRYRQIYNNGTYGPWTNWRRCSASDGGTIINLRGAVTNTFYVNSAFEFEIKAEMYDRNSGLYLWPYKDADDNVLVPRSMYVYSDTIDKVKMGNNVYLNSSNGSEKFIDSLTPVLSDSLQASEGTLSTTVGKRVAFKNTSHQGISSSTIGSSIRYLVNKKIDEEWKEISVLEEKGSEGYYYDFTEPGDYYFEICFYNLKYSRYESSADDYDESYSIPGYTKLYNDVDKDGRYYVHVE